MFQKYNEAYDTGPLSASPQADALLRAAETVLVFTKEAFHVLTGVGKKGE